MKKYELKSEAERCGVSTEKNAEYIEKLSKMINCKTVWTKDDENREEYERFYSVLDELFPNITKKAKKLAKNLLKQNN